MAYTTENLSSGTVGNRMSEKAQLQDFNERFSNYIKNVRMMRDHLAQTDTSSKIHRLEEEVVSIRNMHDQEINALREQLDLSSRDRSRVEISSHQNSQLATEYQDRLIKLNTELMKKDEELRHLQLYVAQKEADVVALRTSKTSPLVQLDLARKELDDLHRSITMCQKKYEEEFALRVKLQDQVWECKDQLQYEKDIHLKESQDLRERVARSEILILQLEEKLRAVSRADPVLIETVQKIQESSEAEMKRFKAETEQVYNQSLLELQMRLNNDQVVLEQVQEQNQSLHRHVDELTAEVTALGKKLLCEEANNSTFIDKLEMEHMRSLQHIRSLEARLEEMQDLLLAKMRALETYQETNVSLQNELKFIKEMLEEEEQHMEQTQTQQPSNICVLQKASLNPLIELSKKSLEKTVPTNRKSSVPEVDVPLPPINTAATSKPSVSSKSAITISSTEEKLCDQTGPSEFTNQTASFPSLDVNALGQGQDYFNSLFSDVKKDGLRLRPMEKKEQSLSTFQDSKAVTSSATGNMKIAEVHASGNFVRLFNCSIDKEEDIGGHLLQQNLNGFPVSVYRFPPKIRVRANTTVMVWAAEAKATHRPPSDFVWKDLNKFETGPEYTTILCKPNCQAIAWYTPVRGNVHQAYEKYEAVDEVQSKSQLSVANEQERDAGMHEADLTRTAKMQSILSTPMLETPLQMEDTTPVLLKRGKEPPKILPPISSPWTQSPAFSTHPDYSMTRTSTMGNDGRSLCRQSRAQTAVPDRLPGSLNAGIRKCKNPDVPICRNSRGPTRSAGPNSSGVMYLGSAVPSGSPLQKYFADSSYNIRLPSQASLTPTIFSNI